MSIKVSGNNEFINQFCHGNTFVVFQFEPPLESTPDLTFESPLESTPDLTFVFRLQAQCTTYAFIGNLIFGNQLSRYKNSKKKNTRFKLIVRFLSSSSYQTHH